MAFERSSIKGGHATLATVLYIAVYCMVTRVAPILAQYCLDALGQHEITPVII